MTVDQALLQRADQKIRRAFTTINAVIVLQHDTAVFSQSYGDHGLDDVPQPVYSVTKSVMSALIGIAIDRGAIQSVEQTLEELLEPQLRRAGATAEMKAVQLHQLLAMTTGMLWRNGRLSSEPMLQRMLSQPHWADFILRLPIKPALIGQFQYNSAASHLLSVILTQATGLSAAEFAKTALFEPLGINKPSWPSDPQGHSTGGWGLQLTPRAMARFGLLYLNQGRWQNQQLVPAAWVAASTTAYTPEYGYQWWLRTINGHSAFMARGLGGQFICCLPSLSAVIVITSSYAGRRKYLWPLFEDYLVPALSTDLLSA